MLLHAPRIAPVAAIFVLRFRNNHLVIRLNIRWLQPCVVASNQRALGQASQLVGELAHDDALTNIVTDSCKDSPENEFINY